MQTKARGEHGQPITADTGVRQLGVSQQPRQHSPLSDVLSSLKETRMIILLQRVFRLGDE